MKTLTNNPQAALAPLSTECLQAAKADLTAWIENAVLRNTAPARDAIRWQHMRSMVSEEIERRTRNETQ